MSMGNRSSKQPVQAATGAGTNRREVLLGATGLAAATAVAGSFGGRVSPAGASAARMSGEIVGVGTFEVLAFSWGISNSGTTHQGGGGGSGKANVQDVSLTRYTDALSPVLVGAAATGQHFPRAVVTFIGKRGTPNVAYEMENVMITSWSSGGSVGEDVLTENVTLNFSSFTFSVDGASTEYDIAGNV